MRYEKYLLEESEIPDPPILDAEDVHLVYTGISEKEQIEYRAQIDILECAFFILCELFDIHPIEIQITAYSISFLMITKDESDFNPQTGLESPSLSRKKLKGADTKEVSGAIIDLLMTRKEWVKEMAYREV